MILTSSLGATPGISIASDEGVEIEISPTRIELVG
jgi:hypothetical protein